MTAGFVPRLIASDVDGTLLRSDHSISPAVRDAVFAARDAGVPVVLASARGPLGMRHLLEELGSLHIGPFIAFQGALVGQFDETGVLRVIHENRMDAEVAREVLRIAVAEDATVNWFDGEDWFFSRWDKYGEWEANANGVTPAGPIDNRILTDPARLGPHKIMIPPSEQFPDRIARIIERLPAGAVPHLSGEHYLEITAPDVDKSHALESVCADYGVPLAEAAAVGDGPNDVGMFDVVGVSVAMGNAPDAVRARADRVTGTNLDDGLAHAIRDLLALP